MSESAALDGFSLPDFAALSGLDRWEQLDETLRDVDAQGVIAPLPTREEQVRSTEVHASRVRTIRTRLHLLGYLKSAGESGRIDDRLRAAVRRFQQDAGILTADGWVGPKTWKALQELVSFEHPPNLSRWMAAESRPLLRRAVSVRLYALGLLNKRLAGGAQLDEGLARFGAVSRLIRLTTSDLPALPAQLELPTLEALFDQDRLVRGLAREVDEAHAQTVAAAAGLTRKQARGLVDRFRVACAKVELWLLGYDVPVDGKGVYRVRRGQERRNPKLLRTYDAVRDFWRGQGLSTHRARKAARAIGAELFQELTRMQRSESDDPKAAAPEELYRRLSASSAEERSQVWTQIRSLGSRLWDGVKRIWRWLRSRLQGVAAQIRQWAVNVARLVHQYALNAFTTVRRLMALLKKTLSVLLERRFPASASDALAIRRSADFDYDLFVHAAAERRRWRGILDRFARHAHLFRLGAEVLGLLLKLLVDTATRFAAGGFALMLALVRIYPRLRRLHRRLSEDQAFLALV